MVGTCKVKSETCADVVYDKNNALVGTELTNLLPVTVCGQNVVCKVAVKIRSRNERRNLTLILVNEFFECVKIVPVNVKVVFNILGNNAGLVNLLAPRRHAG